MTKPKIKITPAQVRAARGALGWPAERLAQASGVSLRTIHSIEGLRPDRAVGEKSWLAIQQALEAAGIEFVGAAGSGPGIRGWLRPEA